MQVAAASSEEGAPCMLPSRPRPGDAEQAVLDPLIPQRPRPMRSSACTTGACMRRRRQTAAPAGDRADTTPNTGLVQACIRIIYDRRDCVNDDPPPVRPRARNRSRRSSAAWHASPPSVSPPSPPPPASLCRPCRRCAERRVDSHACRRTRAWTTAWPALLLRPQQHTARASLTAGLVGLAWRGAWLALAGRRGCRRTPARCDASLPPASPPVRPTCPPSPRRPPSHHHPRRVGTPQRQ
jgi:hypothetical protein